MSKDTTEIRYDRLATKMPGDSLEGGFVLREVLGRGGAGVVFEAWEEPLRRFVAVKLPLSERTAEALVTESHALAAFRHQGLPVVYALRFEEGVPFLVLERLRGHTLEELITRHQDTEPIPWREAIHYVKAVAEILQVLHRAHLVHRDVKPSNVMVCASGRVVLLDLGIVQQERHFDDLHERSGTPAYLAPEVVTDTVGPGSGHFLDIYGLGVVAFELLTGSLPHQATGLVQIIKEKLEAPVPRVRDYCAEVPGNLDDLVHAMMSKSPMDRPDSIEPILYALDAVAEGKSARLPSHRLSVMMVDDDADYRELMRTCVELVDTKVDLRLADNGFAALEMLRERPCDLIVVDLEMPIMNGIELVMYLRGMPEAKNTLVAILSGKARPEDRALLSELGVIDFVEKSSLDLEQFIDRLNAILKRTSAARRSPLKA